MNKKIISVVLLPLLIFSSCGRNDIKTVSAVDSDTVTRNFYNEKAGSVTKNETVYVNLDASGKLRKITVSDWLHTDKNKVYVDDTSELDNIENIKSDTVPEKTGTSLRWHMDERDLYYSGTANKTPPVMFDVEYYLDGRLITPENIAGKSGEIVIKIKIRNNLFKEVNIEGKKYTVTLPIVAVGGMILPGNVFSNAVVKNAQTFNDGTKQLVAFATIPGFNQSLGFENSNEITDFFTADEITVSAYAENFLLENMYFGVIPFATLNFNMTMPEELGDAGTAVTTLKAVRDALQKLDPDRIIYSLISDEAKMNSLLNAMNDASDLYEENQNLLELVAKYSTPENIAAIRRLVEIVNTPEVKAMIEVISDSEVQSFIKGLPVFLDAFGDLEPLLNELQKDLSRSEVQNELKNLPQTMVTLSEITAVLSENKKEIDAISSALDGNAGQSLQSVLDGINTEDLENLEDKYGDVVEDSELIVALAEEWLKFGNEYGLFSGKPSDMSCSLMFIYKTDSIRVTVS